MKSKWLIVFSLVVILAGAVWWFKTSWKGPQPGTAEQAPSEPRPVPSCLVQPLPQTITREFPGKVRAHQRVELAFFVPGRLIELNALEGRTVQQGEVIAVLDQRDFKHNLEVAKANFTLARQNFDRTAQLHKQKVVPEAEYDLARADFNRASAELRISEKSLADTVLTAPFDGVIAARYVENYEHIEAKQAIVSIQNIALVEIVIQVSERLIARSGVNNFNSVKVHLDADGGRWFDASVLEYSSQADPITRTFEVVLAMQPPTDLVVLAGMTATVRAEIQQTDNTASPPGQGTLIPLNAIGSAPDGTSFVWVLDDQTGLPRRVVVEPGETREDGIEIISGLMAGQRVATAGIYSLSESTPVNVVAGTVEGLGQ